MSQSNVISSTSLTLMNTNPACETVPSFPLTVPAGSLQVFEANGSNLPAEVPLSAEELRVFQQCETLVARWQKASLEAGPALEKIRDGRLYRQQHRTFEAYCSQRWGYGKAYSYRLIAAAEIVKCLSPTGDILPHCERQIRPMIGIGLSHDEILAAWARALQLARPQEPTAKQVQTAVAELRSPATVPIKHPRRKKRSLETQARKISILGLLGKVELLIGSGKPESALELLREMKAEVLKL